MDFRAKYSHYLPQPGEEFDVIVCGGGPAGIGAAVAACEAGAKTLLLEASSIMGGVAVAAMWMPVNRITLNGVAPGGAGSAAASTTGLSMRFRNTGAKPTPSAAILRRICGVDCRFIRNTCAWRRWICWRTAGANTGCSVRPWA